MLSMPGLEGTLALLLPVVDAKQTRLRIYKRDRVVKSRCVMQGTADDFASVWGI